VSVEDVEKKYGQGRTLMAPAAKRAGMVDRVETIDMALSRFGLFVSSPQQGRRRGEATAADIDFSHLTSLMSADESVPAQTRDDETHIAIHGDEATTQNIREFFEKRSGKADGDNETEANLTEADVTADQQEVDDNRIPFSKECQSPTFIVKTEGDNKSVYVTDEWPGKTRISYELIEEPNDEFMTVDGDFMVFIVANGHAEYRKVFEDSGTGDWYCELVEGVYEPMPEEASAGAGEVIPTDRDGWMRTGVVMWSSTETNADEAIDEALTEPVETEVEADEQPDMKAATDAAVRARRLALLAAR
jgi:hypothetical protein